MVAPRVHIIGAGQLGRSLGRLWSGSPAARIGTVVCRSVANAEAAVAFIGGGQPLDAAALRPQDRDLLLLATPDDRIAGLAESLVPVCRGRAGLVVFHCSGALSSSVLAPLAAVGASVASVHPLRSFADPARAAAEFAGTWCGVEGEPAALARVVPLFEAAGARCLALRSEHKTLYHAGAVVASNYLVALLEAALRLFEAAGIQRAEALGLLQPLAGGALANLLQDGPRAALSGPILRGDGNTVERQLQAVAKLGLDGVYRELGGIALELSRQRGQAATADLARIAALLQAPPAPGGKDA